MYLTHNGYTYYTSAGEQAHSRAPFLILMECRECPGVRAIVRKVALRQCGHWMIGRARIGKRFYTLSGAYGSDGLLLMVDRDAWERGAPLPDALYQKWAHGDGWNSAGSEAPAMREFGLSLIQK